MAETGAKDKKFSEKGALKRILFKKRNRDNMKKRRKRVSYKRKVKKMRPWGN